MKCSRVIWSATMPGRLTGRSAHKVYRRDMKWLQQCDLFIAEVSGSSFGLGFETGYLLGTTDKRVILLYRLDREDKVSLLITGNTHTNWTCPLG
jgi:nucleoside 2-deoxyribosyltransferase